MTKWSWMWGSKNVEALIINLIMCLEELWKTTGKSQVEQKTYSIKIQAKELTNDGVLQPIGTCICHLL
jgi:hypothetical protein